MTCLPLTPSVDTTTALFSLTSRWLRPRQRTTTLILVDSLSSGSKSRSLRLVPTVADVLTEVIEFAGETAPLLSIRTVAEGCREETCLVAVVLDGGRMLDRPVVPMRELCAITLVLRRSMAEQSSRRLCAAFLLVMMRNEDV